MISTTMQVKLKAGGKTRRDYDSTVPVLTNPRSQGFGSGGNTAAAEEVKHFRLWNFVAISAVANKVSEYFPNVSIVGGGSKPATQGRQYSKSQLAHAVANYSSVLQAALPEDIKPVRDDHPILQLFRTINPTEWWSVFVYEMIVFKRLTGVNYLWVIPNGAGKPAELWNIPPQWVSPPDGLRDKHTGKVIGWKITPDADTSREIILPPEEVIPWRSTNPESKRIPLSPLRATAEWSDSQEAIEQSRVQTFKVGPFPSVLVETPDEGADNDWYLDDTFYRQASEKFMARYGGVHKSGAPLIAPPGYRYKPWSLAPKEMDFNESAAQVRDMILAQHGVPKTIAGITEDVNRASAFAAREVFCRETITPILQDLAGLLTELLASRFDPRIRVWFDDVVPRDDDAFRQDLDLRFKTGSITPRMIAAEYGDELPEDPAFDQCYLPLSLIAVGSDRPTETPPTGGSDGGEDEGTDEDLGGEELDDEIDEGDGAGTDDGDGDAQQSGRRQHAGVWLPERELWTPGGSNGHAPAIVTSQAVLQTRRLTNISREFHRRQAAWETRVGSEVRKFWREVSDDVERRLAAQSSREPDPDKLLPDAEFKAAFNRIMEPLWASIAADGAKLELKSIGSPAAASGDGAALYAILQADELPDIFVEIDPKARKSIRAFLRERAVGIWRLVSATAKDSMRRAIQAGTINGDGPREIAKRIMDKLAVSRQQSIRIARTEATASLNGGAQVVRESEGIEQKIWLATFDNRVRDDHAAADSQVRDNDDPFDVGGEPMLFPGDGSLGAGPEQIVNCRCTATAHIEL